MRAFVLLAAFATACVVRTNEPQQPPPAAPDANHTTATELRPAGAACDTGTDCESSICESEGCEPGGGVCKVGRRMCTRDLVVFCGCSGQTFQSSSSCPGQRYAHRGACEAQ